jgi:amino acid transporter
LANANSGANASTRVIFSLGRSSLLPTWFGKVHPTHRTPVNAVHAQAIIGIIIAIGLGLVFRNQPLGGPLTVYVFIGYALGLLFAAMYILVNIAVIGFYLGERRDEFNPLKHLVVPILGALAVVPAFIGVLGGATIPLIGVAVPALTAPFDIVPAIVAIWMVAGVVLYFVIRARTPEAIERLGEAVTEG